MSALVALAKRCGGEHIILRDVWHYLSIYLFFFSSDFSSRARVCVYVCVYIRMRVRIRIHIRALMTRIIFISVLSSRRCGPGVEDFFRGFSDGWLIGWLVRGWRIRQIYGVMCDVYIMWMLSLSLCICIYSANV